MFISEYMLGVISMGVGMFLGGVLRAMYWSFKAARENARHSKVGYSEYIEAVEYDGRTYVYLWAKEGDRLHLKSTTVARTLPDDLKAAQ